VLAVNYVRLAVIVRVLDELWFRAISNNRGRKTLARALMGYRVRLLADVTTQGSFERGNEFISEHDDSLEGFPSKMGGFCEP
jgi:hypothetical protein